MGVVTVTVVIVLIATEVIVIVVIVIVVSCVRPLVGPSVRLSAQKKG